MQFTEDQCKPRPEEESTWKQIRKFVEELWQKNIGNLEKSVRDKVKQLEDAIQEKLKEFNKKVDEMNSLVAQKLKDIEDKAAAQRQLIQDKIDEKFAALEKKLDDKLAEMKADIERRFQDYKPNNFDWSEVKQYIDDKASALRALIDALTLRVDALEAKIEELKTACEKCKEDVKQYVDNKVAEIKAPIDTKYDELKQLLNDKIQEVKDLLSSKSTEDRAYTDKKISEIKFPDPPKVVPPTIDPKDKSIAWKPDTEYAKDSIVAFNNKIYLCLLAHHSSNDFEADYKLIPASWLETNPDETITGSASGYFQITKYDQKAGAKITLDVNDPKGLFCFPPVEILKYVPNANAYDETVNEFEEEEKDGFEPASAETLFDGYLHLKNKLKIQITTEQSGTGYNHTTEPIDLTNLESIEI